MVGPRLPGQPGVDHDPHAGHGQAALGHRGGQHDPAPAARAQRGVLGRRRSAGRAARSTSTRRTGRPAGAATRVDLPHAGQEHQDVAVGLAQRPAHRGRDVVEQPRVDPQAVGGPDRRSPAGTRRRRSGTARPRRDRRHRRAAAEAARPAARASAVAEVASSARSGRSAARTSTRKASARSVSRCRSWHSSSITAATPASSGSRCSRRSSSPVVTTSTRVRRADPALAAHREADQVADPLADQRGHPAGGGPGRHPARLGDHDPAGERVGQRQRDQRGLAGARRRHQHRGAAAGQRGHHVGQHRADRQPARRVRLHVGQHPPSLPDADVRRAWVTPRRFPGG